MLADAASAEPSATQPPPSEGELEGEKSVKAAEARSPGVPEAKRLRKILTNKQTKTQNAVSVQKYAEDVPLALGLQKKTKGKTEGMPWKVKHGNSGGEANAKPGAEADPQGAISGKRHRKKISGNSEGKAEAEAGAEGDLLAASAGKRRWKKKISGQAEAKPGAEGDLQAASAGKRRRKKKISREAEAEARAEGDLLAAWAENKISGNSGEKEKCDQAPGLEQKVALATTPQEPSGNSSEKEKRDKDPGLDQKVALATAPQEPREHGSFEDSAASKLLRWSQLTPDAETSAIEDRRSSLRRAQGSTLATKGSSTFSLEAGMAIVGSQNNKLTAAQFREFLKACAWGLLLDSA